MPKYKSKIREKVNVYVNSRRVEVREIQFDRHEHQTDTRSCASTSSTSCSPSASMHHCPPSPTPCQNQTDVIEGADRPDGRYTNRT